MTSHDHFFSQYFLSAPFVSSERSLIIRYDFWNSFNTHMTCHNCVGMAKTKDDKFQVVKVINAKNQQFQKICHWSRSITHCRQLCRRAKSVALCCNAADKLSISRPVLSGCTFSLLSSHSWPPSAMISFGFLLFSFSVIRWLQIYRTGISPCLILIGQYQYTSHYTPDGAAIIISTVAPHTIQNLRQY